TTSRIAGTPGATCAPCSFTIRINDGNGGTVDRAFTLTVNNTAPTWTSPAAGSLGTTVVGAAMTPINLVGSDADGHSLSFAVQSSALPPALRVAPPNATTSHITGTPCATCAPCSFTIRVSDGYGGTADRAFTLTVSNAGPVWVSPAAGALAAQTQNVVMT